MPEAAEGLRTVRARRRGGLRLLSAAAVIAVVSFASDAHAGEIENVKTLELSVHGQVTEHCSIGKIGDIDLGDLTRPGLVAQTRMQLSCNIPFDMRIQSANGGIANEHYPNGQGPYAGTVPYSLDLSIPVLKPASAVVTRSLQSREMMGAGQSFSSQGGIALDGMQMNIALAPPPSEAGLLAGKYSETVVITITPS